MMLSLAAVFLLMMRQEVSKPETPAPGGFNRQELQRIVENSMRYWRVPGVALVMVHGDETLFEGGFGVQKVGGKDPVNARTLFPLASCSKAFTSALAAGLVAEGKLGWEDKVQKHLPWFALSDELAARECTLSDLFSHRTGIGNNDLLWYRSGEKVEDLVRRSRYLALDKPFRTSFQYQSTMFGAGGLVCEAAGKGRWEDLLKKELLDPLGMKNTFCMAPMDGVSAGHAVNSLGLPEVVPAYGFRHPDPAGSVHSCAADMAYWLKFQLNPKAMAYGGIKASTELSRTHKPLMINPLDESGQKLHPFTVQMTYGMGWVIQDYKGVKLVSHAGAIDGFRCHVTLVPEHKLGFAILANLEQTRMNLALSNTLVDLFFSPESQKWDQELARNVAQAGKDAKEAWDRKIVDLLKKHPGTMDIGAVVGAYYHPAYGKATLEKHDKKVRFTLGSLKVDLNTLGGAVLYANDFVFDNPIILLEKDAQGKVAAIQCQGRLDARFEKKP